MTRGVRAGLAGHGGSSYIDTVVLRDKDNNGGGGWTGTPDGIREQRHYYAQNWRADVSVIVDNAGDIQEWDKYRAYGVPFLLTPADHNKDGAVAKDDSNAFDADYAAGNLRADLNKSGTVTTADQTIFNASYAKAVVGGRWKLSAPDIANRKGYAGYEHDGDGGVPELAHVRNRVLHFGLGRWTRRDPAGYVDGMSLPEYIGSQPVRTIDPTGLCRLCFADDGDPWDNVPSPRPEEPCPVYSECKRAGGTLEQLGPEPSPDQGECGSPTDLVPDNPFGFKFLGCCRQHDACYGRCATDGEPRTECDDNFCECLDLVCVEVRNPIGRAICYALSGTYCNAVRLLGRQFYCASQTNHCMCEAEQ